MTYKKGQRVRIDKDKWQHSEDMEILKKTNYILTIKEKHFMIMVGRNMYEVEELPRRIPKSVIMEIV
jgi:hypothetical protein